MSLFLNSESAVIDTTKVAACSFLMRGRKREDLDGRGGVEELQGAEGGETVFRLYHMVKEYMINKRGIKPNQTKNKGP